MLAGNVVALCSPLIFVPVLSFVFKSPKYDWISMKQIRRYGKQLEDMFFEGLQLTTS